MANLFKLIKKTVTCICNMYLTLSNEIIICKIIFATLESEICVNFYLLIVIIINNCGRKKIFCGKFDILVDNLNLMQRCVRSHPELLCIIMHVHVWM